MPRWASPSSPPIDGHGVAVVSVDPGSAAEKAGLQNGDVITKVDDTAIDSPDTLGATIAGHQPGDHVTVTYTRDGTSHDRRRHPRHPISRQLTTRDGRQHLPSRDR